MKAYYGCVAGKNNSSCALSSQFWLGTFCRVFQVKNYSEVVYYSHLLTVQLAQWPSPLASSALLSEASLPTLLRVRRAICVWLWSWCRARNTLFKPPQSWPLSRLETFSSTLWSSAILTGQLWGTDRNFWPTSWIGSGKQGKGRLPVPYWYKVLGHL